VATLDCHRERSPALSFDQPDTQQVQQPCCYVALSAVRGCPPTQRRTLTLGATAGQQQPGWRDGDGSSGWKVSCGHTKIELQQCNVQRRQ
jgi:hypothetical protein